MIQSNFENLENEAPIFDLWKNVASLIVGDLILTLAIKTEWDWKKLTFNCDISPF